MRRFEAQNDADALVTLGDNDYTESPAAFRAPGARASAGCGPRASPSPDRWGTTTSACRGVGIGSPLCRCRAVLPAFGDVELFVLDSNNVNAAQTSWLERALASSNVLWKVAVLHHPAFTCGSYHSHPNVVRRWVPLFERYGVRIVLSGHDHNYQRFVPRRGVTYVVHGGGAGAFYPITACPKSYPRRFAPAASTGGSISSSRTTR